MDERQALLEKFGVTDELLDAWAEEYESDDWSHMRFGEVVQGRPRVADEKVGTITVKVPESRLKAIERIMSETGITRSEFVRRAIDNELVAIA